MKEPEREIIDLSKRPQVSKDHWTAKEKDPYELSPDELVKREAWLDRLREGL